MHENRMNYTIRVVIDGPEPPASVWESTESIVEEAVSEETAVPLSKVEAALSIGPFVPDSQERGLGDAAFHTQTYGLEIQSARQAPPPVESIRDSVKTELRDAGYTVCEPE